MGSDAIHVGVDVGQKQDPSTIVVAEVSQQPTGKLNLGTGRALVASHYRVHHLERLPLGTAYPDVATHLVRVLCALHERNAAVAAKLAAAGVKRVPPPIGVFIDATGVGQPVVDILQRAIRSDVRTRRAYLFPLTFVHGDKYDRGAGRLGKAYLVSRLQALLQERCIDLPANHPEAAALVRELKDYEIRIDAETASDRYGAFRVGTHDDLATALGLACLDDPLSYGVSYGPQMFG